MALGTVLEAAPDSQLVVEPGVCIGAGTVIQAFGGQLTLASGANVGRGSLVLGSGIIGAQACIGAESTLINPKIEANQVIPARSLLGDTSRCLSPASSNHSQNAPPNGKHPTNDAIASESKPHPAASDHDGNGSLPVPNTTVYGRDQVQQLVKTLFPHRDAIL